MTDTLFQRWLALDDPDWNFERPIVVKARLVAPQGGWYAQKPGRRTEAFDDFKAAIAYATDADR